MQQELSRLPKGSTLSSLSLMEEGQGQTLMLRRLEAERMRLGTWRKARPLCGDGSFHQLLASPYQQQVRREMKPYKASVELHK